MQKRPKETKEHKWYKVRKNICEGEEVRCLPFTAPLIDFGQNESDEEDCGEEIKAQVKAKRKWLKLYQIIMDKRT